MKSKNDTIRVIRGVITLMRGIMKNRLYVLEGHATIGTTTIAEKEKIFNA